MSRLALNGGSPVREEQFPQWPVFDKTEEEALLAVLKSGVWGIGGKMVPEFCRQFAALHNSSFGISVVNGTVALQLALLATGIRPGNEVIVPAYTFVATASAVLAVNAVPVFADVNPNTYTIAPEDITAKLTDRTKAIIPVHLAGHPADLTGITEIAKQHDLVIIEDCAQAHCAEWEGKPVGTFGDLACFSFQSSKNMTSGEGGIVITNDEQLADKCWSYHDCGRTHDGVWYQHPYLGWNYRMTEFQAALLIAQMQRLNEQTTLRMDNAAYLSKELEKIDGIMPLSIDQRVTRHAFHLYVFKFNSDDFHGLQRSRFLDALNAEGIPASPGYVPLYKEGFLKDALKSTAISFVYDSDINFATTCPVTERACYDEAIWLTQNVLLGNKQDMDSIIAAISKIRKNSHELVKQQVCK